MANNDYYKKRRQKTKKIKEQIEERNAPINRFDEDRKKKTIVSVIAIGMVVLMLATMIIPYIGRVSNNRYTLPEATLQQGTVAVEQMYNPQSILGAQILTRPDQTYYVLVGNPTIAGQLAPQILGAVYIVDTTVFENRGIQTGEGSSMPSSIEDIRYNEIALLKVEDGHITAFENGQDNVQAYIEGSE